MGTRRLRPSTVSASTVSSSFSRKSFLRVPSIPYPAPFSFHLERRTIERESRESRYDADTNLCVLDSSRVCVRLRWLVRIGEPARGQRDRGRLTGVELSPRIRDILGAKASTRLRIRR